MLLFTHIGIYILSEKSRNRLQVQCVAENDLRMLMARLKAIRPGVALEFTEDAMADYPFTLVVPRDLMAAFAASLVQIVNYPAMGDRLELFDDLPRELAWSDVNERLREVARDPEPA
jgi:hypothetical protein